MPLTRCPFVLALLFFVASPGFLACGGETGGAARANDPSGGSGADAAPKDTGSSVADAAGAADTAATADTANTNGDAPPPRPDAEPRDGPRIGEAGSADPGATVEDGAKGADAADAATEPLGAGAQPPEAATVLTDATPAAVGTDAAVERGAFDAQPVGCTSCTALLTAPDSGADPFPGEDAAGATLFWNRAARSAQLRTGTTTPAAGEQVALIFTYTADQDSSQDTYRVWSPWHFESLSPDAYAEGSASLRKDFPIVARIVDNDGLMLETTFVLSQQRVTISSVVETY